MRKIAVYLSIGYPTAEHRATLVIEDDLSEEDVEREVQDWAYNFIDYGWEEVDG